MKLLATIKLDYILSLNEVISSRWEDTKKIKEELQWLSKGQLSKQRFRSDTIRIHVRYNSNHDVDNISPTAKIIVDMMRAMHMIEEDTPEHYKAIKYEYDGNLPFNTFIFEIYE